MTDALFTLDHFIRAFVVSHRTPALDYLLAAVSAAGRGGLIWLLTGIVLTAARRIPAAGLGQLALALLVAWMLADFVLKPAVGRHRPFIETPEISVIGPPPRDASFPSGHAASAFSGALVLACLVPRARILWWTLAVVTAYSRVYLGVHYPLDVIAGAIVGIACAALVLGLTRRDPAPPDASA